MSERQNFGAPRHRETSTEEDRVEVTRKNGRSRFAGRCRAGRQDEGGPRSRFVTELQKIIVGQDDVVGQVLLTLFVGGNSLIVGVPGLAKTLLIHTLAKVARPQVHPHPVHARPDAVGHHRHRHHQRGSGDRPAADGVCARARSSATSCSPTRSTARRRRRSRRCSRRCRSTASRFRAAPISSKSRSSCSRRRTRSSSRARIRCPKRSSIASCSTSSSSIRRKTRNTTSCGRRRRFRSRSSSGR